MTDTVHSPPEAKAPPKRNRTDSYHPAMHGFEGRRMPAGHIWLVVVIALLTVALVPIREDTSVGTSLSLYLLGVVATTALAGRNPGLLAAVIILVLAFGSVIAMGLPIGIALIGLLIASAFVALVSNFMTMPNESTSMVAMIGLGVGIDYALFIVTRYREGLRLGLCTRHLP